MLIILRLAIAFAILAPAVLAGVFRQPLAAFVAVVVTGVFAELVARYVRGQRTQGRSTPFSEIVMILVAIVMGVFAAVQVSGG